MTICRSIATHIGLWSCLFGCLGGACAATPPGLPQPVSGEIRRRALLGDQTFPEGIAADGDMVFVGGVAQGEIQRFTAHGVETFKQAHADGLLNVIGLAVDATRHRLWVCSTSFHDPTGPAALVVFDTRSAELLASLPIPADGAPHFLNDVDVDSRGTAYATDSVAPIIWTVPPDLSRVEVLVRDPRFVVDPSSFNLNGLAVTPGDRYLIASLPSMSDSGEGKLFRVDLDTRAVSAVAQDRAFAGADGLTVLHDRTLIASGGVPGLFRLEFDETYTQAHVEPLPRFEREFALPTTAAVAGGYLWVVNSQLDHYLVDVFGDQGPPALPFEIVGVRVSEL